MASTQRADPRQPTLLVALGRQRVGKTTLLSSIVQHCGHHGAAFELWNADQQNRSLSLSTFFQGALVPEKGGLVDGRKWIEERLEDQVRRKFNAVLDPGGGWTGFSDLVATVPVVSVLGEQGVRVIGLFVVGPERADIDYLEEYAGADLFMPGSTMIVLNGGLVLSGQSAESAFRPIAAHPAVQAAVTNGAKTVLMPALGCMAEVTDRGLLFEDAADGTGKAARDPISFLDRARVQRWWRRDMQEFFAKFPPGWLPSAGPAGVQAAE